MRRIFTVVAVLYAAIASAQINVSFQKDTGKTDFSISSKNDKCNIVIDDNDYIVVKKSAGLLASDIKSVTDKKINVSSKLKKSENVIIIGTIEKNEIIKKLAKSGKIDVSAIKGEWERYMITTIENPFPNVKKALIIAGSDRRGAAYGALSISENIGVSPWYWWADVAINKHKEIYLSTNKYLSKSPSVKFRGIFINDEDWGMKPWAAKNFEKERGNLGPRTYAKICELLLRMKANYMAPAMHPVSTSFYQIPENKLVADSFAIVMGSSHCEPLLLNTASEWDKKSMGPWDYNANKDKINEVLDKRVKESAPYENVYTLALRGLHDGAMNTGSVIMSEKAAMLEKALNDQRNIVAKNIDKPIETIPQAFTPYKEVLDIYSHGLKLPDDVTIIWPDDNFGYMKRVSNPTEQKRSGHSGVYYHVSYLGVPHSYMWFSTTPPALMYEELKKVYDSKGDRLWMVNCGDLKGSEMQVSLFLDMAYDFDKFNYQNITQYQAQWLSKIYGPEYYNDFLDLTTSHTNLSFQRKPEYMGWGFWNNYWGGGEICTDTEFSFCNYNEAEKRLNEYSRLGSKAKYILNKLPKKDQPSFYQLLYYPVKGSELMNRMRIGAQQYREFTIQNRASCEDIKNNVKECFDSLHVITDRYNSQLNGKWRYMMSLRQNYDGNSTYFLLPDMKEEVTLDSKASLGVNVDGENADKSLSIIKTLPTFSKYAKKSHWVDIYNKGKEELNWNIDKSDKWIKISQTTGKTYKQNRIQVDIDWENVPSGDNISGYIDIKSNNGNQKVYLAIFNPASPSISEVKGMFVETDGYVSISASDYTRKIESNDIKMNVLEGLGIEGKSVQIGNPNAPLQMYRSSKVPRLEYDFYTFGAGMCDVYTYVLPTFPLHSERDYKLPEHTNSDTKYSVCIDNGNISTPSTSAIEYSQLWYDSALRNCRINKSTLYISKPGKHTLQIRCGDPGTIIQKIVINMGGLKKSYLGPESTQVK